MLRGDEGKGKQSALPENARAALGQMLKEGLGDHILLLRLYQVGISAPGDLQDGLPLPTASHMAATIWTGRQQGRSLLCRPGSRTTSRPSGAETCAWTRGG